MLLPSIYAFDDYRKFLAEWMAFKQERGNFSMRGFAKTAGFRAHNMLPLILRGKRNLSLKSIVKFARAIGFTDDQGAYFETLVLFNQSANPKEAMRYFDKLTRHPGRRRIVPLEQSRLSFFKHWLAPVIYELTQVPGFRPDADWIAKEFEPELDVVALKRILGDLQLSGFVRKNAQGDWESTMPRIETGNNIKDLHLFSYHEQALLKAADALEQVPAAQRNYRVITSAVPANLLPELTALAEKFEAEIWNCIDSHTEAKTDVVQISLQIFPAIKRRSKPKK